MVSERSRGCNRRLLQSHWKFGVKVPRSLTNSLMSHTFLVATVIAAMAALIMDRTATAEDGSSRPVEDPSSSRSGSEADGALSGMWQAIREFPYWTDEAYYGRYRLQSNPYSGRFRVRASSSSGEYVGTRAECLDFLERHAEAIKESAAEREAVVFLRGLARSPGMWKQLSRGFEEAGYATYAFDYASTLSPIEESADTLARVIDSLDGHPKIHLVVHSMGGLVTRAYFKRHEPEKIGRIVMLGTPNRGAAMADRFHRLKAYRYLFGQPGQELTTGELGIAGELPVPDVEFAIIAGSFPRFGGLNPLVRGDDDGMVTIESTRLDGAADFLAVPNVLHQMLLRDGRVVDAAVRFVRDGTLRESGEREPIQNQGTTATPDDRHR